MHLFNARTSERNHHVIRIRAAALLAALAIALLLSQTAFAQTTYVITDGSRVLVHTTTATDPEAVLGEAGLELGAEDTYTTHTADGTAEIQIVRSHSITIHYYGQQISASSGGETVQTLLDRLNLTPAADDAVSPSPEAETFDGMEITVARVTYADQTYSAVLHHETTYCSDPTLPQGVEKVLIPGVDGELLCTATVTYVNGIETERQVLREDVIRQPVDAVIARGTGQAAEADTENAMPIITENTITLPTGEVLTYDGVITSLATAYCDKGRTATGTQARVGAIAVDPRYIPYGTRMFIMSEDGEYIYGIATAEDCGSLEHIVGTRIDLHFDTYEECRAFGARDCLVFFLS